MIEKDKIENIVLFVDDAVRYDYSHERLSELGQTHSTISASLHTPASFASIFSGYHVPTHGVTSFREKFDNSLFNIFDLNETSDYTVGLSPLRGMNKSIGNLFSNTRFESHEEIEPPFIWLHRGPGGHAPYGEYDYPEGYTNNRKSAEYLDAVAGDTARFRDDYNKGVEKSIDFFEKIQADFKQRGLKDKTLFIYTSDHGEILGEYGYLGHNHLACPELVRVPTTFIHPEITSGYDDRLLHNVDMVPIISDLLDIDNPRIEGFNSLERQRRVGYNHFENMFYTSGLDRLERVVKSVWDDSGGMVKIEGNRLQTTAIFAGLLLKSAHGKQIRSSGNIKNAYKRFVNNLKYENPDFSELKMEKVINQSNSGPRATSERRELSSDEIEHLKDLGYV